MLPPPPPPTQSQAADAQRVRHAAETAILSLFKAADAGGEGSSEEDESSLHALRIAAILALLSAGIASSSFRNQQIGLRSQADHEEVAERVLEGAQSAFNGLLTSELTDEQRATVWATWAYSEVAEGIARGIDSGEIPSALGGHNLGLNKVWISRSDGRVRKLHAKLHGETIPTGKDFWRWPHTGQRLRWPGDKDAPLDATIGCRCVCLLTWADKDGVSETIRKIIERENSK